MNHSLIKPTTQWCLNRSSKTKGGICLSSKVYGMGGSSLPLRTDFVKTFLIFSKIEKHATQQLVRFPNCHECHFQKQVGWGT